MKRIGRCVILTFFLFFIAVKFAGAVYAQYMKLELENPGQQINVGDVFNVNVLINTQGVEAINGDTLILFDPTKINILNGTSRNFFTFSFSTMISGVENKFLASSWEESIAHAKSSTTDMPFYTISIKAEGKAQTQLAFECATGSEADTNINRSSDSADVVKCPLQPLNLNIGDNISLTTTP